MSEDILHNQNNNQFDENNTSIGLASTLRRAMTVTKIDEMLQCISDMKLYANTIEQDLPDYLNTVGITSNNEMSIAEIHPEDLIEQAQQRSNDDRYILLRDLIKSSKKFDEPQSQSSIKNPAMKSSFDQQITYMKRVIAAQPTALEAIYLEALFNPDQWQYYHEHLLRTSPMDNLTDNERQRLNELLDRCQ